jgi:membrane protein DedA with SNARE-associated domain
VHVSHQRHFARATPLLRPARDPVRQDGRPGPQVRVPPRPPCRRAGLAVEGVFDRFLGDPFLQAIVLFLGPFAFEEAAILAGAALAAGREMSPVSAFALLYAGIVLSDWSLYAAGVGAGRSRRIRAWVGETNIARGRELLDRGAVAAAISARLVPWLLLPVFVASGFLGVGFVRFALVNAVIAFGYLAALFLGLYLFNVALFDIFAQWGWFAVLLAGVALLLAVLLIGRRYGSRGGSGGGTGGGAGGGSGNSDT